MGPTIKTAMEPAMMEPTTEPTVEPRLPEMIVRIIKKTNLLKWGVFDIEQTKLRDLGTILESRGLAHVVRKVAYFEHSMYPTGTSPPTTIYALKIDGEVFGLTGVRGWDGIAREYCKEHPMLPAEGHVVWRGKEISGRPSVSGPQRNWAKIVDEQLVLQDRRVIKAAVGDQARKKTTAPRKM